MGSTGKFFVGGNWKSNGTKESVSKLVKDLNAAEVPSDIDIIVAPTFLHLQYVVDNIAPKYQVSAQNCWVGKAGAYTGEVCFWLPFAVCCKSYNIAQ
jgi:triosephosphate isomerase